MRLFIAAQSQITRASIINLLAGEEKIQIVGAASSVSGSLNGVSRFRPDAIVLDVRLCTHCSIDLQQLLRTALPTLRIVLLADQPKTELHHEKHCLTAGADYILHKSLELGRLPEILSDLSPAL